jgi:hypothetical protein
MQTNRVPARLHGRRRGVVRGFASRDPRERHRKTGSGAPTPGVHSIWKLLFSVESRLKMTLSAVDGVPIPPWPGMPIEMDWPAVTDTSAAAWKLSVVSFFFYHLRLVEKIDGFTDERLRVAVPGRTYDFYRLFEGTIQHTVYHAGQISVLKKAGTGREAGRGERRFASARFSSFTLLLQAKFDLRHTYSEA